jgi:hypothetical protein
MNYFIQNIKYLLKLINFQIKICMQIIKLKLFFMYILRIKGLSYINRLKMNLGIKELYIQIPEEIEILFPFSFFYFSKILKYIL